MDVKKGSRRRLKHSKLLPSKHLLVQSSNRNTKKKDAQYIQS